MVVLPFFQQNSQDEKQFFLQPFLFALRRYNARAQTIRKSKQFTPDTFNTRLHHRHFDSPQEPFALARINKETSTINIKRLKSSNASHRMLYVVVLYGIASLAYRTKHFLIDFSTFESSAVLCSILLSLLSQQLLTSGKASTTGGIMEFMSRRQQETSNSSFSLSTFHCRNLAIKIQQRKPSNVVCCSIVWH